LGKKERKERKVRTKEEPLSAAEWRRYAMKVVGNRPIGRLGTAIEKREALVPPFES